MPARGPSYVLVCQIGTEVFKRARTSSDTQLTVEPALFEVLLADRNARWPGANVLAIQTAETSRRDSMCLDLCDLSIVIGTAYLYRSQRSLRCASTTIVVAF